MKINLTGRSGWIPFGIMLVALFVVAWIADDRLDGADSTSQVSGAQASWLIGVVLVGIGVLIAGQAVNGRWSGALIDSRNRYSLAQTQAVVWLMVISSALIAAAVSNVHRGVADPLDLAIPAELLAIIGLAVTSIVGTPLIRATKLTRCASSRSRKSRRSASRSSRSRTTRRTSKADQQRIRSSSRQGPERPEGPGDEPSPTSRTEPAPADAAGEGRPALPAGGGHAAGAGDAAPRRSPAEREGRAEEALALKRAQKQEGQGLVSVRRPHRFRASRRVARRSRALLRAARARRRRGGVHPPLRGGRAQDRRPGPGPAHDHRRGDRRARRDPAARARQPDVVAGPHQSNQVSIVNGRMSQSRSLIYVLQPRAVARPRSARPAGGQSGGAGDPDRGRGGQRPPARAARGRTRSARTPSATRSSRCFGRRRGRAAPARLLCRPRPRGRGCASASRSCSPTPSTRRPRSRTSSSRKRPQFAGFWVEDLERPAAARRASRPRSRARATGASRS